MRLRGKGLRISFLLLGANAFVLLVPILSVIALRLYDNYLVRQTERQLIAQSVAVGEIWRELWLDETHHNPNVAVPSFRHPGKETALFIPIEPESDLRLGVLAPQTETLRTNPARDTPALRAGKRLEPLLRRMQVYNLSALRVLDSEGCVVATTRGETGFCLDNLPEVQNALQGKYSSVIRERTSDEPLPPLSEVRSRGSVRLFTALPLFSAGQVVAVIRASRTSLDARTSLWHNRKGLLIAFIATVLAALLVSILFATLIVSPLRKIAAVAQTIAHGGKHPQLPDHFYTPGEIRQLGVALTLVTRRLRERADYVAELAANVSHELKTPITAIRGAAELLRDESLGMTEEEHHRFANNIVSDAERMQCLVNRLLQLARIENANEPTEKVDIGTIFHALSIRYSTVHFRFDHPPQTLLLDEDHLRSAVVNLIENALRHSGEKPVEVRVSTEQGRLRIDVTDRGTGISPANQPRIFQRFFTTHRDQGGTGLGLAIVRAVAERQGGNVMFVTGPHGTTFTLLL